MRYLFIERIVVVFYGFEFHRRGYPFAILIFVVEDENLAFGALKGLSAVFPRVFSTDGDGFVIELHIFFRQYLKYKYNHTTLCSK